MIKKTEDGVVVLESDDKGEFIFITDTDGKEIKYYPEVANANYKKLSSENIINRQKKSEYKKSFSELETKYNKVNDEYTVFKEKNSNIEDQLKQVRMNISKEYEDKYSDQLKEKDAELTAIKRKGIENSLLKSKALEKTTYHKTDYIRNFGEFVQDDGTFLGRDGQVIPGDNGEPLKDMEKAMEILVKTHPAGEGILKSDVKSGFGSYNDKSAKEHNATEEKVTLDDFNKVLN